MERGGAVTRPIVASLMDRIQYLEAVQMPRADATSGRVRGRRLRAAPITDLRAGVTMPPLGDPGRRDRARDQGSPAGVTMPATAGASGAKRARAPTATAESPTTTAPAATPSKRRAGPRAL